MHKPRIRVAYVINDLLLGGAQIAVLHMARSLDRSTFDPYVYYLNEYEYSRSNLKSVFAAHRLKTIYIGTSGKTSIGRAVLSLLGFFRKDRPDIVHCHLTDATIAGVLAAWIARTKSIIVHEQNTHTQYSRKIRVAYRFIRKLASLTICYSTSVEKELFNAVHLLSEPPQYLPAKSCTVLNGVDIAAIDDIRTRTNRDAKRVDLMIPPSAKVVVSVARLVGWKGQEILVSAFIRLASAHRDLHVAFVGEGPLQPKLEATLRHAGLSHRAHFFGARNDALEILAVSDICSLAFIYEPDYAGEAIGIAGFEAMAMGVPLIASNYVSVLNYADPGKSIVTVDPDSTESLASGIEKLLVHEEYRQLIGAEARRIANERLDWRFLVPIYERIYALLIAEQK